ncbi:DUF6264 family protein [Microbacterium timonense]|uniref:DUF6264 family protein n=1 Tax=Microbacterium timonense TaxID=2086576 RepID=UPI000D101532|nr:DUF6264 family protein [Microbacterium timonense]
MSDPAAASAPDPRDGGSSRPAPRYGQYATPEEQRARIREPAPWQAAAAEPAVVPAPAAGVPAAPAAATAPKVRPVDRIVTFALLAYGLVNVLTSVPAFLDYGAYAETMLGLLGVDATLSDPGAGHGWAIAAALVLIVGWCATAVVSLWNLRRGRLTWWIPLVAGVVFTFAAGILMVVPLMGDPVVWQAVVDSAGGAR